MGGCFSGQKGLESENAPVEPKENVVETPKEAPPLVDISEAKEEVKKESEVVVPKEAEVVAEPVAEEKVAETVSDVKEEAKVAEVETANSGTEDKTSVATAVV